MEDALITSIRQTSHKVLTRGEEHALALRSSAGDTRAREQLILRNQRLVYSIARSSLRTGLPYTDLVQAGNLGLIRAVDKFDAHCGFKLSTYATWWIKQSIDRYIAVERQLPQKPWAETKRLQQALLLYPDANDAELAELAQVRLDLVRPLLDFANPPGSLDADLALNDGRNEDGGSIAAQLVDATVHVADDALAASEAAAIRSMLQRMKPRYRRALELRYGLDGPERTLEEIGAELGITREGARQLIQRALTAARADRVAS